MTEQAVLASIIESRDAFEKVYRYVDEGDLSPQGRVWLPLIKEWYQKDASAKRVDLEALRERGRRNLPEKHLDTLIGYLDTLPNEVSPMNVVADVLELQRFTRGNQLCAAIQGRDQKKIDTLLEEYASLRKADALGTSEVRWTEDDSEMLQRLNRENLIKIAPQSLNNKLKGGAARGDHIVVFGRPEAGKTMFTVNMVAGFLKFDHKVLYIGNEEDTYKVRKRIVCNLASCTPDQFEDKTEKALGLAKERGLDNLRICHMFPGTIPEIEDLLKEIRPDVIVLDQIRNLTWQGKGGDSMVSKLEQLGIAVRSLLGRYDCLGVSITQAGHPDHTDPWLRMEDLDNSKTGLPGTADVIIGVGANDEMVAANQRAISLCKNKLNEDPDGKVGFMVQVDPARSKIR